MYVYYLYACVYLICTNHLADKKTYTHNSHVLIDVLVHYMRIMDTQCPKTSARAGKSTALFPRVILACRRLNPAYPKLNLNLNLIHNRTYEMCAYLYIRISLSV